MHCDASVQYLGGLVLPQFSAMFGAVTCGVPASFFVGRGWGDGRDSNGFVISVNGNEGDVSGGGLDGGLGDRVLAQDLDADLHAGAVGVVDHCAKDDVVSDIYRLAEGYGIDGSGDADSVGVSLSSHRGDHVNPGEDDTTEDSTVRVCVIGHDEVAGLNGTL